MERKDKTYIPFQGENADGEEGGEGGEEEGEGDEEVVDEEGEEEEDEMAEEEGYATSASTVLTRSEQSWALITQPFTFPF